MICVISANKLESERWARSQLLDDHEWFHASRIEHLIARTNFHVIVVPNYNIPSIIFEPLFKTAKERGSRK